MNVQISNFTLNNIELIKSFKQQSPEKSLELAIDWLREHDPRKVKIKDEFNSNYEDLYKQVAEEVVNGLLPIPVVSLELLNTITDKHIALSEEDCLSHYEGLSNSFIRTLLTPSFEAHFDEIFINSLTHSVEALCQVEEFKNLQSLLPHLQERSNKIKKA